MATIIKKIVFSLSLLFTLSSTLAHTIYADSDIPLLNNRVRIDPFTEQITFLLHHTQGPQAVVLVRPDGSKLYYSKHPKSVAWVSSNKVDIITIDHPVAGPWQAIADLNGNNRIKLISPVKLKTDKLPLKLYTHEYITTYASLYHDDKLMTDNTYLHDARLSVALIGKNNKKLTLYKDNGQGYDALPFDGTLTARIYVNLIPGNYLLSIRTKNNVFIRNQNQDAIVVASPINYEISQLEYGSKEALFKFAVNSEELDPESVIIDGLVKDENNNIIGQLISHSAESISAKDIFTQTKAFDYGVFSFSGKAFATTRTGREIELQLPVKHFELLAKVILPPINISAAIATVQPEPESIWKNIWVISTIAASSLILLLLIIFIVIRRRRKSRQLANDDELSLKELTLSELQPESLDLNPPGKETNQ
ncbi:MAG: hypothetical protein OQK77_12150 [Psychromonas sp.]|nr:hypothetical protein [Psychromonas sp.]